MSRDRAADAERAAEGESGRNADDTLRVEGFAEAGKRRIGRG